MVELPPRALPRRPCIVCAAVATPARCAWPGSGAPSQDTPKRGRHSSSNSTACSATALCPRQTGSPRKTHERAENRPAPACQSVRRTPRRRPRPHQRLRRGRRHARWTRRRQQTAERRARLQDSRRPSPPRRADETFSWRHRRSEQQHVSCHLLCWTLLRLSQPTQRVVQPTQRVAQPTQRVVQPMQRVMQPMQQVVQPMQQAVLGAQPMLVWPEPRTAQLRGCATRSCHPHRRHDHN